jgi:hypothetical protein
MRLISAVSGVRIPASPPEINLNSELHQRVCSPMLASGKLQLKKSKILHSHYPSPTFSKKFKILNPDSGPFPLLAVTLCGEFKNGSRVLKVKDLQPVAVEHFNKTVFSGTGFETRRIIG